MPMKHPVFLFLAFGLLCSLGCTSRDETERAVSNQDSAGFPANNKATGMATQESFHFSFSGGSFGAPPAAPPDGAFRESSRLETRVNQTGDLENFVYSPALPQMSDSSSGTGNAPASNPRKLIQNFNLEVAVKDLDEVEETLKKVIESAKGFISMSDRGNQPG